MSTSEEWRAIVGFEGYYEVSNRGRVRSLPRGVYAGQGRMRNHPMTVLSIYTGDHYSKVRLKYDGEGSTKNVHSLVAEAFIGPRPVDLEVCHNNGNPHDNRIENLRYDSHSANSLERRDHGRVVTRHDLDECVNGHPYTDDSNYVEKSGKRVCRVCDRERGQRARDAAREAKGLVRRSERTECYYGHPLDGLSKAGKRFCMECNREAQRRYRARRSAD